MFYPGREELAWAAGFFDGEGSTAVAYDRRALPRKLYRMARLNVTQAGPHAEVLLKRFQAAIGGLGTLSSPRVPKPPSRLSYCQLTVNGHAQVQAAIAMLWSFLGPAKRTQASRVLKLCVNYDPNVVTEAT